ncbi:CHAT domain-containing protein [Humibacillus xanthopallidus]|uniref:CHAT domain-containing protein n=1 Tax=Humibacillus xanthopallidus TaxID=412689 RepID=UPI00384ECB4B
MALFKNDVSEYVTAGRLDPARLVVTILPDDRDPDRHDVTAQVDDDGGIATGSFVVSPEWRLQGTRPTTSKIYPTEPNRARIGAQLFSALFSGALSRCWAQAVERGRERGGLHIVIRSTSYAVHALPWELLTDPTLTSGSQYVVMSEGWSVIRDRADPDTPAPAAPPTPLAPAEVRILALTSPINGIDQTNDPAIIRNAFPQATMSTTGNVRPGELTIALKKDDAHLVHVLGTGHRARQGWQDLVIGSTERPEVMSGKSLSSSLRESSRLRILVLAACDSDQLAAQLATTVPAVIGIRGAISDPSCLAFLGGFYAALGSGSTVAQAVASGRAQQIAFASSLGDEWAQPVLFQSEDHALVLSTSSGDEPSSPATADTPGTHTPQERIRLLEQTIRQANLRALREQWDPVEPIDTPAFVQRQIDDLTAAVEAMSEVTR